MEVFANGSRVRLVDGFRGWDLDLEDSINTLTFFTSCKFQVYDIGHLLALVMYGVTLIATDKLEFKVFDI